MSTKMLLQVLSAAAIGSALVALSYIGFVLSFSADPARSIGPAALRPVGLAILAFGLCGAAGAFGTARLGLPPRGWRSACWTTPAGVVAWTIGKAIIHTEPSNVMMVKLAVAFAVVLAAASFLPGRRRVAAGQS